MASILSLLSREQLDETISGLEDEIDRMDQFCRSLPAPCVLYDANNIIMWSNFHMLKMIKLTNGTLPAVGKHVSDVVDKRLSNLIIETNARVRETHTPHYDDWTWQTTPHLKCRVLRFPVNGRGFVGALLLPEDLDFFLKNE